MIEEFEGYGYDVQKDWRVLNAADYGVPQDRQRLILMGVKHGCTLPTYPATIPARPTCGDALGDLPNAEQFEVLNFTDSVEVKKWATPSEYAMPLRGLGNDAWKFGHPRKWNPARMTSSARTDHTDITRRRFAATDKGRIEPISRLFKLPSDGVSNTLRAGTDAARGAFTSPRPIHFRHNRCVTVREMARLHGFPDWFRLHATKWHGARQVGNSVPPPLARAVADQIVKALGFEPTRPSKAIDLGDEALLQMDMSKASAYWKVAKPNGKRDRKSGAKKRKQHEIEAFA